MNNTDDTGHRQVGYVRTYDESRLRNLRIQLQDFLFDKGHTINKPMVDDLAIFVYELNESHFAQGKLTTTKDNDLVYFDLGNAPDVDNPPKSALKQGKGEDDPQQ